MREDTYTTTVDGAAGFERMRDGGEYGERWDGPSQADGAEAAFENRAAVARQYDLDAAARARGKYVPTSIARLTALALGFVFSNIEIVREDETHVVLWVPGVTAETPHLPSDAVMAYGGAWVRKPLIGAHFS